MGLAHADAICGGHWRPSSTTFPTGRGTTLALLTLVAAVSFSTLAQVLGVAGTYLVIAMIEGQLVQPLLVGRRMEVNPLLIFLGLWFGGMFWGIAGIILATPTLVALKVIAENSRAANPCWIPGTQQSNRGPRRQAEEISAPTRGPKSGARLTVRKPLHAMQC